VIETFWAGCEGGAGSVRGGVSGSQEGNVIAGRYGSVSREGVSERGWGPTRRGDKKKEDQTALNTDHRHPDESRCWRPIDRQIARA